MAIAKNFYNPIPFHTSKDEWYDNRRTFNGAHSHIYVPHNEILPFQLTLGYGDITFTYTCNVTIYTQTSPAIVVGGSYSGGSSLLYNDGYPLQLTSGGVKYEIRVQFNGEKYKVEYWVGNIRVGVLSPYDYTTTTVEAVDQYNVKKDWLTNASAKTFYFYHIPSNGYISNKDRLTQYATVYITGNMLETAMQQTLHIVNANTNEKSSIGSFYSIYPQTVPMEHRNASKYYSLMFPDTNVSSLNLPIGTYYLEYTLGNAKYYSEPFEWVDDTDNLILIRYRRTQPISDAKNYLDFSNNGVEKYMKMYVPAEIMMPEYSDEEESVQNDGFTFIEKIVSYKTHKFTFPATEFFADAIRMVRHCNDVQISQHGVTYDVDYVAAPKISWEDSNHFCVIECGFRTDTIIQTNGESASYIRGSSKSAQTGSFDNSFDSSFN